MADCDWISAVEAEDETTGASSKVTDEAAERSRAFWDGVFGSQEESGREDDWLAPYDCFRADMRHYIPTSSSLLIIGCGNAKMSADMYDDGYRSIVNTDISPVVIENMRARHAEQRPEMQWAVADVFALSRDLPGRRFDAVVDKAALDSVLFRHPANLRFRLADVAFAEVANVLAPGGVYFCVSPRRRPARDFGALREWRLEKSALLQAPERGFRTVSSLSTPGTERKVYVHVFRKQAKERAVRLSDPERRALAEASGLLLVGQPAQGSVSSVALVEGNRGVVASGVVAGKPRWSGSMLCFFDVADSGDAEGKRAFQVLLSLRALREGPARSAWGSLRPILQAGCALHVVGDVERTEKLGILSLVARDIQFLFAQ
eukprot:m51a1_g10126 hypothetical protein (375) ;mRNA; f:83102-84335